MAREVYYPVLSYAILRYSAVSSFKMYYRFHPSRRSGMEPVIASGFMDRDACEPSHDVEEA